MCNNHTICRNSRCVKKLYSVYKGSQVIEKHRPLKIEEGIDKLSMVEIRKLKYRDAARIRRGDESSYHKELSRILPIPKFVKFNTSKITNLRIVIAYIKLLNFVSVMKPTKNPLKLIDLDYLNKFDLFFLILNKKGEVICVFDDPSSKISPCNFDVLGNPIYDIIHPNDHKILHFNISKNSEFIVRVRSNTFQKGRLSNIKHFSYKAMKLTMRQISVKVPEDSDEKHSYACAMLESFGFLKPESSSVSLESNLYSTHSLDMNFLNVSSQFAQSLCFDQDYLVGKNFYHFVYPSDSQYISKIFKEFLNKGSFETLPYRIMTGNLGYIWVVTELCCFTDDSNFSNHFILCTHNFINFVHNPFGFLYKPSVRRDFCNQNSEFIKKCRQTTADDLIGGNKGYESTEYFSEFDSSLHHFSRR